MSEELLHEKITNLKELIEVKLDGMCKEISGLNTTLKEHNGRLTKTEKLIEQIKGAGSVVGGFWGLVAGGTVTLVVAFLKDKF